MIAEVSRVQGMVEREQMYLSGRLEALHSESKHVKREVQSQVCSLGELREEARRRAGVVAEQKRVIGQLEEARRRMVEEGRHSGDLVAKA